MCYDRDKIYKMTVILQGKKWNGGAWVDTQIQGTNTNGMFQIIPPDNMPDGKYGIEIRSLNIGRFNHTVEVFQLKVKLTNMPQINGYNNSNQSNNNIYGIYTPVYAGSYNTFGFYHEGDMTFSQVVGGIGQLKNGLIQVAITDEKDVPIVLEADHTWFLSLDFKKID
jgi:hypothetical protein